MKINWNWKVFLLCPIWSFGNKSFFGLCIFVFPAIIYGSLLTLMKIPPLADSSAVLIMFFNILYAFFHIAVLGAISFVCKTSLLNNSITAHIIGATYYVLCSAWLSIINDNSLFRNKSRSKILSVININNKKWSRAELLMVIPIPLLVIITNYINASMLILGLEIMP